MNGYVSDLLVQDQLGQDKALSQALSATTRPAPQVTPRLGEKNFILIDLVT